MESVDLNKKTEVTKDELQVEMLQLPNVIHQMRMTLIVQERELSGTIAMKQEIDIKTQQIVSTATTKDTGCTTFIFKNKMMRDAEVKTRLQTDKDFLALKQKETKVKEQINQTHYDIEFCFNRLKSLRKIAPYYYGNIGNDE